MERGGWSLRHDSPLGVVTYTLEGLRRGLSEATATTDVNALPTRPGDAFFFEAFVTAAAKGETHTDDAFIAAREAHDLFAGHRPYRSAIDETEIFSLLGASLLRTGWTTDLAVLSAPRLVVKPGFNHHAGALPEGALRGPVEHHRQPPTHLPTQLATSHDHGPTASTGAPEGQMFSGHLYAATYTVLRLVSIPPPGVWNRAQAPVWHTWHSETAPVPLKRPCQPREHWVSYGTP